MTISIEQLLEQSQMKLLAATVEIIEKDTENAQLKDALNLAAAENAILRCKLQRATVPFNKRNETPSLCRRQAG